MILTNRTILSFLIISIGSGSSISVRDSYDILKNSATPIHATPHINNLIRNGIGDLDENERDHLKVIGLQDIENSVATYNPTLDQSHDTDHFRFFYTLDDNDAVEDVEYVIAMGTIFEEAWAFHIDTMGFDVPPLNSDGLYEVRIENLPSFYFGYAVAIGSGRSCDSYIKMRNSYSASQFSDHTEEENIKVTAVHEFFHAIQFDYNCHALEQSLWFLESTAVWSEDELYDDINDLYRYMPSWFSNPNKPIFESSNHMYGSFIFFQYIDEHLGGRETIRSCWEQSRDLANATIDVTFEAIDNALDPYDSSFEDTYLRMRVANRILSDELGAYPYNYDEAEGYKTVISPWGTPSGPPEQTVIYEYGNTETVSDQTLGLYESLYFSLATEGPVSIVVNDPESQIKLSSIIKLQGRDQWTIRSGNELNIDPEIGIDWISLVVSATGTDNPDLDWMIKFSDGYSEDFTAFSPYPNPSYGKTISMDLQVITGQMITTRVFDILGREVWSSINEFISPTLTTINWSGLNKTGSRVSNGVYYFLVEGDSHKSTHKVIYLKKN